MQKNIIKTIILTLIFIFIVADVSAQNQLFVQLVEYNAETQQSKIHIQNNAGFELNELDFYVNNIKTGRIANKLGDGKAVLYFQTISPGTYDISIKTKEGIEFTKEIKFEDVKQVVEPQPKTTRPKTASELAEDKEYQEFLREKQKEEEIRKQREEAKKVVAEKVVEKREIGEEKLEGIIVKKPAEKPKYSLIILISILIFIFILIFLIKKKKRK